MITYTLKIVEIIRETEDSRTIFFKQPSLKKIKYISGQYITLIISINNRKYQRPYSLSSAPGVDNTLNITVKRVTHGIVSNHIIDVFKEGDLVEIIEPMGDFIYDSSFIHNDIYLWGAGSGITPLMSILKSALHGSTKNITLSYCSRRREQTIFYQHLIQLKKDYPDRFLLNLFCTKEQTEDTRYGRIGTEHVLEFMPSEGLKTTHYICGPNGLKETIKNSLLKYGISKEQILSEDFEHVVNEIELKDIQTQTVEIKKSAECYDVEVVKGKSILEAGLDLQIDLSYSCQTGTCTLCKARLLSGSVKTIGVDVSRKGLKDNEHLLCCSYPYTDNVKFEID